MVSSVTIDDELRRKIKKIAAILDTTQGEVVARAITLFEQQMGNESYAPHPEARNYIQKAALLRQDISWRIKIRNALKKPGPDIDDIRISLWGDLVEDQSR